MLHRENTLESDAQEWIDYYRKGGGVRSIPGRSNTQDNP